MGCPSLFPSQGFAVSEQARSLSSASSHGPRLFPLQIDPAQNAVRMAEKNRVLFESAAKALKPVAGIHASGGRGGSYDKPSSSNRSDHKRSGSVPRDDINSGRLDGCAGD
jgi:hypothetical protein